MKKKPASLGYPPSVFNKNSTLQPLPQGEVPIYYIPSSRTVCKRTPPLYQIQTLNLLIIDIDNDNIGTWLKFKYTVITIHIILMLNINNIYKSKLNLLELILCFVQFLVCLYVCVCKCLFHNKMRMFTCVLLCFIIPILGNRYGPGVNSLRQ